MAGHAQLKFVMTECSKTQIRLTRLIYIPPENSSYSHNEPYYEISEELKVFEERYSNVLLFGDFNSRRRKIKDYIDIDQSVFHETDT